MFKFNLNDFNEPILLYINGICQGPCWFSSSNQSYEKDEAVVTINQTRPEYIPDKYTCSFTTKRVTPAEDVKYVEQQAKEENL